MASKTAIIKQIRNEGWYIQLVEEAKALLGEAVKSVRKETIRWKWLLGNLLYEQRDKGITDIMSVVAKDIGISERECWRCYRFREVFPNLLDDYGEVKTELFPEGENMSWNKIVNKYNLLTSGNPCQHDWQPAWRCRKCKTITINNPNVPEN